MQFSWQKGKASIPAENKTQEFLKTQQAKSKEEVNMAEAYRHHSRWEVPGERMRTRLRLENFPT